MNPLVIFGGIGGILAALGAVVVVGRGIFKQVNATEDNTAALRDLTDEVKGLKTTVNGHETRITVLEDRGRVRA
jgi:hypothetical protein